MSAKKIARFMQSLTNFPDVTEVILWHLSVSQRRAQVARHDGWDSPDDIASTLWEEARNVAAAFPGPQSFVVTAHEKPDLDLNSPVSSTGFKVDPVDGLGPNDQVGSEPPNAEGITSQLMRHVENKERIIGSMFGTVVSYLVRDNEKKSDQIEQLLNARNEAYTVQESLISQKHVRDMEIRDQEAKKEKTQTMLANVMQYLPLLVNHLSGQEIVRQKESEMEMVSMELAKSVSGPQLDALRKAGLISPTQSMLLTTLIEKTTKRMMTTKEVVEASVEAHKIANDPGEDAPARPAKE